MNIAKSTTIIITPQLVFKRYGLQFKRENPVFITKPDRKLFSVSCRNSVKGIRAIKNVSIKFGSGRNFSSTKGSIT